jgi:hypothetical protein
MACGRTGTRIARFWLVANVFFVESNHEGTEVQRHGGNNNEFFVPPWLIGIVWMKQPGVFAALDEFAVASTMQG